MTTRELVKLTWLPVLLASLCCLTPIVMVLLGLSTISFAVTVGDTLYWEYDWIFRGVGAVLLATSLVVYLRREKGICTIDDFRKRRNEVINIVAFVFIVATLTYVIWLYGALELIGHALGLWR